MPRGVAIDPKSCAKRFFCGEAEACTPHDNAWIARLRALQLQSAKAAYPDVL